MSKNRSHHNAAMPLTVFDTKGIPATRRELIEAAVEAGGKHVAAPYEAWIAADEEPAVIMERVRATLDE